MPNQTRSTAAACTVAAIVCLLMTGRPGTAEDAQRVLRVGVYTPHTAFSQSEPGREFIEKRRERRTELRETRQEANEQRNQQRQKLQREMTALRSEKPEGWREDLERLTAEIRRASEERQERVQEAIEQNHSETEKLQEQAWEEYEQLLESALAQLAEEESLALIVEEGRIGFRSDSVELVHLDDALAAQLGDSEEEEKQARADEQ